MNPAEFRKLALSFPGSIEAAHVGHPDFRINGKIFATLGYPDEDGAVLLLSPEEQQELVGRYPKIFAPVAGGWGRRGSTKVTLREATMRVVEPATQLAWERKATKHLKLRLNGTDSGSSKPPKSTKKTARKT